MPTEGLWTLGGTTTCQPRKKDRKLAAQFEKTLCQDGFGMFQFSMYVRHSSSAENADVHKRRVKNLLPLVAKVGIYELPIEFDLMGDFSDINRRKYKTYPSNWSCLENKNPAIGRIFTW